MFTKRSASDGAINACSETIYSKKTSGTFFADVMSCGSDNNQMVYRVTYVSLCQLVTQACMFSINSF